MTITGTRGLLHVEGASMGRGSSDRTTMAARPGSSSVRDAHLTNGPGGRSPVTDNRVIDAPQDLLPMMSLEDASLGSTISNYLALFGLVVGVAAGYGIYYFSGIKETYFQQSIARATERAEVANADASKANLQVARLKAPRSLSDEQREYVAEAVSKYPNISFHMTSQTGNAEANSFGEEVRKLLLKNRWRTDAHAVGGNMTAGSGFRVLISEKASHDVAAAAEALRDGLKIDDLNVPPVERLSTWQHKVDIAIVVGSK